MNANFDLKPNIAAINQHLYLLFDPAFVVQFPGGRIEIAYGTPPNKGQTFPAHDLRSVAEFAAEKNARGENVYVGMTLKKADTAPFCRTSKEDFLAGIWAWSEFDGKGEIDSALGKLRELDIVPSVLIKTGTVPHDRGHLYYQLDAPVADPDVLVAANEGLQSRLGGDPVQDVSRIMRLAGTVNYPTKDKAAKGYATEIVTITPARERRQYSPSVFSAPNARNVVVPFEMRRSDDELTTLLRETRTPGHWHNAMLRSIATMVGRGWNDVQIRMACAQYCNQGAEDQDLDAMIESAREKWSVPDFDDSDEDISAELRARTEQKKNRGQGSGVCRASADEREILRLPGRRENIRRMVRKREGAGRRTLHHARSSRLNDLRRV
jgi:hypothetical protein